jgi:hypothetical protein
MNTKHPIPEGLLDLAALEERSWEPRLDALMRSGVPLNANAFLKAEKIVSQGLGLLQRDLVLTRLVKRFGPDDFRGAKNDTINIRIPSLLAGREYEFRTRTQAIIVDELKETSISVVLNKHAYSAVGITDEELTLDITSWGEQVARPQVRAVGERLEGYVAKAMETDADYLHEVDWVEDDPDAENGRAFYRAALRARKYLNGENVPRDGRVLLLGSSAEEAALNSPHLIKANEAGSDQALREAVIGRIAGFTCVGTNSVDENFAVGMHPTAFALGNVAPVVPEGASAGATMSFDGLNMRWVRDYDSDHLRDRSVYSAFAGTASVEDARDMDVESEDFGELLGKNARAVKINFTPFDETGS